MNEISRSISSLTQCTIEPNYYCLPKIKNENIYENAIIFLKFITESLLRNTKKKNEFERMLEFEQKQHTPLDEHKCKPIRKFFQQNIKWNAQKLCSRKAKSFRLMIPFVLSVDLFSPSAFFKTHFNNQMHIKLRWPFDYTQLAMPGKHTYFNMHITKKKEKEIQSKIDTHTHSAERKIKSNTKFSMWVLMLAKQNFFHSVKFNIKTLNWCLLSTKTFDIFFFFLSSFRLFFVFVFS